MNLKSTIKVFSLSFTLITVIFIAGFTLCPIVCNAVPAAPRISEITQPDGTKFKARLRGDEWNNWVETEDGYTVLEDTTTGWWYYAIPDDEHGIKRSMHPAGKVDPTNFNIKKGLLPKMKEHPNKLPPRRN